jgi:hypothetical protein
LRQSPTSRAQEQPGGKYASFLHSGAQYTAKQPSPDDPNRLEKSAFDPTFGGFKNRWRGIEWSFLKAMALSYA